MIPTPMTRFRTPQRAALDAYAGDDGRSPIDAQHKAFAEQVILAGKMRRNEV